MKKLSLCISSLFCLLTLSCQDDFKEIETTQKEAKKATLEERPSACPSLFALVLPANGTGSPILPNIQSFIFKIDLGTSPVGYTFVSQIKIGGTPVTCVTGITDMTGTTDFAWAVTGINSNFPKKLLKVHIPTGNSSIVYTTTDYLQDIENLDATTLVGIKEDSSQILKLDLSSGACSPFAPSGFPSQYNGLTIARGKLYAISGNTSFICPTRRGDIFEYELTGGDYINKYSYKSSVASYTMKELGLHFDFCYGKGCVVGSAQAILSNNTNIKPCITPYPSFLLNTVTTHQNYHGIYDFMTK
ncbi:hypothetical protein [Flavobacterium sp. NRK F7]|uniref:hypothetical protein n=1 Tax=Flavobacterium sp. NRK F7 TaxID=2954930 RepID=UPI0020914A81|nr:hypothetical protein [Flavobacterium sp. NRK F7]MCO6164367.1 hypothetical protein [Flavobacterium sp. NRK F7]